MELLNPTLTVRNTTTHQFLVRMEHQVSEHGEYINLQLLIPHQRASVQELQRQLVATAIERLQSLHAALLTGS